MKLWDAIKAKLFWQQTGGQWNVPGGTGGDWWNWPYAPGTAYDYSTSAGRLWDNPVVAACIGWLQRAFPEPVLVVERREAETGEWNVVPDHPLPKLLAAPNPFHTGDELWQAIVFDWVLSGNAYLIKVRAGTGAPLELWHVPAQRLRPQWNVSGTQYIDHYRYVVDGRTQVFQTRDVIHFRFGKDPRDERLGWSPLLAGLREVAALNEGANYRGAILRNMGVPSHILSPKDPNAPLTREAAELLHAMWRERASGDARGRPIIPSLPLEVQKIAYSPAELDVGGMLNLDADAVCALLGLSSQVIGISAGQEHKTYANYSEAREAAVEQSLIPTQGSMARTLTGQLLPDLGNPDQERVAFEYSKVRILQEDESAKFDRLDKAVKTGWVTPNEARAKVGLPEIEGGDELKPASSGGGFGNPGGFPESAGDRQAQAEAPAAKLLTNGYRRQGRPVAEIAEEAWDAELQEQEDARAARLRELEASLDE